MTLHSPELTTEFSSTKHPFLCFLSLCKRCSCRILSFIDRGESSKSLHRQQITGQFSQTLSNREFTLVTFDEKETNSLTSVLIFVLYRFKYIFQFTYWVIYKSIDSAYRKVDKWSVINNWAITLSSFLSDAGNGFYAKLLIATSDFALYSLLTTWM